MIVNAPTRGLDARNGIDLDLLTVSWEDILPAVASASGGVDVGFASLAEYLAKERGLNRRSRDPIRFFCPLYVYKGGAFISWTPGVPTLVGKGASDVKAAATFLNQRIGAQKNSIYDMVLHSLARRTGFPLSELKVVDIQLNDGLLATQSMSLDIAAAGLTQTTEAIKSGGRIVLRMEDLGFADITGLICRDSLLRTRRADVLGLVRSWFDSVAFVYADLRRNCTESLAYLKRSAATRYTFAEYERALSQEYIPRSPDEARSAFMSEDARFSIQRIADDMAVYLSSVRGITTLPIGELDLGAVLKEA
jgi:ABC-type nitrate/sulfonate/bicarbonate transport system substrate-binding protein